MNSQKIFQKVLPHFLILLGFVVAGVIYNSPILTGKKLNQSDLTQASGAAHEAQEFYKETGELTLWTNSMFAGMPTFMVFMDYASSITLTTSRFLVRLTPAPANYIFLFLAGLYVMLVMLGYSPWVAVLGGIGYAFASYNIISIEVGHVNKILALAYAPPFIGAVILTYRGKYLLGGVLAAVWAGLEISCNHLQITYYFIIALVIYAIFELITTLLNKGKQEHKSLKTFGIASATLALAAIISVGTQAVLILPTYEYTKDTIRGGKSELTSTKKESGSGLSKEYAFRWSYGIIESFSFVIPNFLGGGSPAAPALDQDSHTYKALERARLNPGLVSSMPIYWGAQPGTAGPAYMGAIVCFLFFFGLMYSKDPIKWWLLTMTILFTMFAWGKNFSSLNYFIFDTIPLYNKFRAITMLLSVVQFFVVWMAVLGLQELFTPKADKLEALKYLKYSAGLVGGFVLVIALLGGGLQDFKSYGTIESVDAEGKTIVKNSDDAFFDNLMQGLQGNDIIANSILKAIEKDRAALQSADAWRSFIFILLTVALMWLYLIDKLNLQIILGGIILLTLIDMWALNRRYLNEDNFVKKSNFSNVFDKSEADKTILADKDLHFRVFNQNRGLFSDGITSYHHKSIGGYHAAKLQRFNEISEAHLFKNNIAVYNMFNIKYFITSDQGLAVARQNPGAVGNAWFAEEIKWVKNADEELEALNGFDPKKTAVIDERFKSQIGDLKIKKEKDATIKLTSYAPNKLVYESNATSAQLAVFSEVYYVNPGKIEWTAYIDGKEVPHLRVDYILRALKVPAGKHTIEFKFDAKIFHLASMMSLISSIILVLGVFVVIFIGWQQVKNRENT